MLSDETTPRVEVTLSVGAALAGKPSATTVSPCSTPEPLPSGAARSPEAPATRSSARSSHGALPTSSAGRTWPSIATR